MSLTLHIYRDPASFLQAIETVSGSDGPIDIDTAVMNLALGGTYDARNTNKAGVWMIVTQADIQLGSTLHSETYALTVSRAVNTQQSPILLIMISTNLQKYDMTTQIPLPVGADESIEKFFNDLLTSVVEVTYGKHLPQVHSAFGPQIIVHSFLDAWRVASERASNVLKISEKSILATNMAYMTREKSLELFDGHTSTTTDEYIVLDISTIGHEGQLQGDSTTWDTKMVQSIKDQLLQCIIEFFGSFGNGYGPLAEGLIREAQKNRGKLWVCITKNETAPIVVGYVHVGRETARTISIRQVFTKADRRGKGIAANLVKTICTKYLTGPQSQHNAEKVEREAEVNSGKDIVTLYVAPENTAAVRTYSKVGFTIHQVPWEWRGFEGVPHGWF